MGCRMSLVKTKKIQIGDSITSSHNFTFLQPSTSDGTLRIGHGNPESPSEILRINNTEPYLEVWDGAAWGEISGGGGDFLPLTGGTLTGNLEVDAPQGVRSRGVRMGGETSNWNGLDVIHRPTNNVVTQYLDSSQASSGYEWRVHNDGSTFTNAMTLTPAGNLNVSGTLAVSGSHTATGAITANGGINIGTSQVINHSATNSRDKIRVWNSALYTIGMNSTYTLGGLNDYAMTFQMNSTAARGWWWGNDQQTNAQGAMSLTTGGLLHVSGGARIGFGNNSTAPGATGLTVNGTLTATTITIPTK